MLNASSQTNIATATRKGKATLSHRQPLAVAAPENFLDRCIKNLPDNMETLTKL
ncbi:hypothetical protein [Collimonas sp.]|uniref:hypothetical protein n=1 Tax=Collimonas sp. TaxID=1963772 RepID=UPI0037BFBDAE